jgi:hypothetical protein
MWIETRIGPGAWTGNVVRAHGEIVDSSSAVAAPASPSEDASSSVLTPSTREPVPTPVAALPAYVVHSGIRHIPIDALPWEVVTFRTVCGRDLPVDEHGPGDVTACEWCRRFELG